MPEPGKPLDKEIVEQAYQRYADGESINSIAKVLHTTGVTLHKYRKKQNWTKRIKRVNEKLAKVEDTEIEKRKKKHIRQYAHLAAKGSKALRLKDTKDISTRDAISAIDTGIKGEREVLGDTEQDEITITLKLPKGMKIE